MRRPAVLLTNVIAALVFYTASGSPPAAAAIRVAVSFIFVEVEVSPRPQVHREPVTHYYTLSGRSISSQNSIGTEDSGQLGVGHRATNVSGDQFESRLKVSGANRLTETNRYPSFTITTIIQTNGRDACTAAVTARLKPGHSMFEDTRRSNHEHMIVSDLHFEDVGCTISN